MQRTFLAPGVVDAEHWHVLPDGRVQCDLCPRECKLAAGQRGFCFVRERRGEGIVLTTYGRASGFCVDPIEKKPLNHFLPGSRVFSFGTAGCNLGCRFCQNWGISKARAADRLTDWASPEAVGDAARQAGCASVAFTYNDPVVFAEYAMDCAEAAHDRGLKTVGVTAGYISPAARPGFFRHLDAANVDLKAFTQGFYGRLCFGRLQPVLDTLVWLKQETRVWLEVTTLLIPGENDSESEIEQLSRWFLENLGPTVPLHFTAFHPDFKLTGIPRTPASTLLRARRQALAAGLHHVYVGNLSDSEGQDTSCHACGTRVIQRQGYTITGWDLRDEGSCRKCGNPIPGHFSCAPDTTPRRPSRCRLA